MSINNTEMDELKATVKNLVDITTRIDERMLIVKDKQESLSRKVDENNTNLNEISRQVSVLEAIDFSDDIKLINQKLQDLTIRLEMLSMNTRSQENRWSVLFDLGLRIVWVIIAAYVLYKLGYQPPAIS